MGPSVRAGGIRRDHPDVTEAFQALLELRVVAGATGVCRATAADRTVGSMLKEYARNTRRTLTEVGWDFSIPTGAVDALADSDFLFEPGHIVVGRCPPNGSTQRRAASKHVTAASRRTLTWLEKALLMRSSTAVLPAPPACEHHQRGFVESSGVRRHHASDVPGHGHVACQGFGCNTRAGVPPEICAGNAPSRIFCVNPFQNGPSPTRECSASRSPLLSADGDKRAQWKDAAQKKPSGAGDDARG